MTREEAIEKLKTILKGRKDKRGKTETDEAIEMAIQALEQEPNIDMNSEEIKILQKRSYLEGFHEAIKMLKQEPKTGHWIYDDECKEHGHCSECGHGDVDLVDGAPHNYCQNCGAKMVEPEKLKYADNDTMQYADMPAIMPTT